MLKFDILYLLKFKSVNKKMAFLYKRGFTKGKSYRLIQKNVKQLRVSDIELLCKVFNCTPNDLFTYEESVEKPLPDGSALKALVRQPLPSFPELISDLTVEQASEFINKIRKMKLEK